MKPIDYGRDRPRDRQLLKDSWTPIYEPGPVRRFLRAVIDVAIWAWNVVRFWGRWF